MKKSRIEKSHAKRNHAEIQAFHTTGQDAISFLSPEILALIADHIVDMVSMSSLSRTSKRFFALMTPRLYHRVAVAVPYHAHIPKMIRTLEPHLTIRQKKQLKKEGKYKGQQEKYSAALDEDKVPICASYVSQLVLSYTDPGKKHINCVLRYYEEALRNMKNLEIVESVVANEYISEAIASLSNLQALSISMYNVRTFKSNDVAPLASVKNLKHFHVEMDLVSLETSQSILLNSRSTLRSLSVMGHYCNIFQKWSRKCESEADAIIEPTFPELRSLEINGTNIDKEFVEQFPRIVNFPNLREVTFGNLDMHIPLWHALADVMKSCQVSNTPVRLRYLSMEMYDGGGDWSRTLDMQMSLVAAKASFIGSFDTLTSLKLQNYGQYSANISDNPGISEQLLQRILKHKNLTELHISYLGVTGNLKIPYVGPYQVGQIIDGLPQLHTFNFAPEESQMDQISKVLSRGRNLEHVTCFPYDSWSRYNQATNSDPEGSHLVLAILKNFLMEAHADPPEAEDGEKFIWEQHFKLKRIDLTHNFWDIASDFGKRQKGDPKPEVVRVAVRNGFREVSYRPIKQARTLYDPLFNWTLKVEKDIR